MKFTERLCCEGTNFHSDFYPHLTIVKLIHRSRRRHTTRQRHFTFCSSKASISIHHALLQLLSCSGLQLMLKPFNLLQGTLSPPVVVMATPLISNYPPNLPTRHVPYSRNDAGAAAYLKPQAAVSIRGEGGGEGIKERG